MPQWQLLSVIFTFVKPNAIGAFLRIREQYSLIPINLYNYLKFEKKQVIEEYKTKFTCLYTTFNCKYMYTFKLFR